MMVDRFGSAWRFSCTRCTVYHCGNCKAVLSLVRAENGTARSVCSQCGRVYKIDSGGRRTWRRRGRD